MTKEQHFEKLKSFGYSFKKKKVEKISVDETAKPKASKKDVIKTLKQKNVKVKSQKQDVKEQSEKKSE